MESGLEKHLGLEKSTVPISSLTEEQTLYLWKYINTVYHGTRAVFLQDILEGGLDPNKDVEILNELSTIKDTMSKIGTDLLAYRTTPFEGDYEVPFVGLTHEESGAWHYADVAPEIVDEFLRCDLYIEIIKHSISIESDYSRIEMTTADALLERLYDNRKQIARALVEGRDEEHFYKIMPELREDPDWELIRTHPQSITPTEFDEIIRVYDAAKEFYESRGPRVVLKLDIRELEMDVLSLTSYETFKEALSYHASAEKQSERLGMDLDAIPRISSITSWATGINILTQTPIQSDRILTVSMDPSDGQKILTSDPVVFNYVDARLQHVSGDLEALKPYLMEQGLMDLVETPKLEVADEN